mgnify:CR=1 FL=1
MRVFVCLCLQGLRTLGLGGLRCADVPALAPLTRLRHLMLEPAQPPRQPGAVRERASASACTCTRTRARTCLRTVLWDAWVR